MGELDGTGLFRELTVYSRDRVCFHAVFYVIFLGPPNSSIIQPYGPEHATLGWPSTKPVGPTADFERFASYVPRPQPPSR